MSVKGGAQKRETEKMSDGTFRMMTLTFGVVDFLDDRTACSSDATVEGASSACGTPPRASGPGGLETHAHTEGVRLLLRSDSQLSGR